MNGESVDPYVATAEAFGMADISSIRMMIDPRLRSQHVAVKYGTYLVRLFGHKMPPVEGME